MVGHNFQSIVLYATFKCQFLQVVVTSTQLVHRDMQGKSPTVTKSKTYVWLRPGCCPDLDISPPTRLDLSPGCWESWLKRTLVDWGGLSSLWPESSSYCLFMAAGTTWKRMTGRRMACLKMFWALRVIQSESDRVWERERRRRLCRQKWIKRYKYNNVPS